MRSCSGRCREGSAQQIPCIDKRDAGHGHGGNCAAQPCDGVGVDPAIGILGDLPSARAARVEAASAFRSHAGDSGEAAVESVFDTEMDLHIVDAGEDTVHD